MEGIIGHLHDVEVLMKIKEIALNWFAKVRPRAHAVLTSALALGAILALRYIWRTKQEILKKEELIANYPALWNHRNLMAKHLTPEIYVRLSVRTTAGGFSLDQAVQSGVDCPGDPHCVSVGFVAGEEESYTLFAELFLPIIEERHNCSKKKVTQHVPDNNMSKITGGHLDENFVLSCRVRTCRSIRGFKLPPACSRKERRCVEKIIRHALVAMGGSSIISIIVFII